MNYIKGESIMKKFIINLLTIICIISIVISSYKICTTLIDYKKSDDIYYQIREIRKKSENKTYEYKIFAVKKQ